MQSNETGPKNIEAAAFPFSPQQEIAHLRELVAGKGIEVLPVGDLGYIAFNSNLRYRAEAPLILLDWDDTGAQTTKDKARCWEELKEMGIAEDVVGYCDEICRVMVGDEEPTYEPELEMRLLSLVLDRREGGSATLTDDLKGVLDKAREDLVKNKNLNDYQVKTGIKDLYARTRFSSTLYPDTEATLTRLRGSSERPLNVGILTYGDPSFQFEKVKGVLEGNSVGIVFLTKVRKGQYFSQVLKDNPFKDMALDYTYPETPRQVGVDFKSWNVPIFLFDDDPKQVVSFNEVAKENGLQAVGVVRVRREGIKRAESDTELGDFTAEIKPSDSFLDTELFAEVSRELQTRTVERYLLTDVLGAVKKDPSVLDVPDVERLIHMVAQARHVADETVRNSLLRISGMEIALSVEGEIDGSQFWVEAQGEKS